MDEPQEITNDLDQQQERYQAAQASAHLAAPSAGADHQASGDSVHPPGYYPPDDSTGASRFLENLRVPCPLVGGHISKGAYERAMVQNEPLFVSDVEAARCVLLAPHKIPLKELTSLRMKSFRAMQPKSFKSSAMSSSSAPSWSSGSSASSLPTWWANASSNPSWQDWHVLHSLALLRSAVAQSASKCSVKTGSPATSLGAGAFFSSAAPREPAPHGSGVLRSGQEAPVAASLDPSEPSSSTTVALRPSSAPQAQPVALQQ
ncbi:unnamed protein product [Phytophthora lilii]|uniref:Unnamed protein product n=1 Tax=Phytophthora lilii TaxID=2077276 RepID=A0A9W6WNU7_9STRA|nr:unnamed protein product [Phytophthora lilii]